MDIPCTAENVELKGAVLLDLHNTESRETKRTLEETRCWREVKVGVTYGGMRAPSLAISSPLCASLFFALPFCYTNPNAVFYIIDLVFSECTLSLGMVVAPLLRFPQGMRCMSSNLYKTQTNIASKCTCSSLKGLRSNYIHLRNFSTTPATWQTEALDRTRNIGIIAHIDAGKTTTTERMLFYSGFTRRIGDVDEGSTVTDFLPAERARGITIQSAAITFHWPPGEVDGSTLQQAGADGAPIPRSASPHTINLIDTPGHADFTFEVMRSLRILDGAVCILDGVAGVEAQTEQVWNQASTYKIPRVIYVNKLDRDGAAFGRTVREVRLSLGCLSGSVPNPMVPGWQWSICRSSRCNSPPGPEMEGRGGWPFCEDG